MHHYQTQNRGDFEFYVNLILEKLTNDLNDNRIELSDQYDMIAAYFSDYIEFSNAYIAKYLLIRFGDLDTIFENMRDYKTAADLMHADLYNEFCELLSAYDLCDLLIQYECAINNDIFEKLCTFETE